MLAHPELGQQVLVWYRPERRVLHPHLHGRRGRVVAVSLTKPLNHAVRVRGRVYVIPCGNLNKLAEKSR